MLDKEVRAGMELVARVELAQLTGHLGFHSRHKLLFTATEESHQFLIPVLEF